MLGPQTVLPAWLPADLLPMVLGLVEPLGVLGCPATPLERELWGLGARRKSPLGGHPGVGLLRLGLPPQVVAEGRRPLELSGLRQAVVGEVYSCSG